MDNGLLRLDESKEIEDMFKNNFSLNFHRIDASDEFISKLKGVTDPEQKRKIVANLKNFLKIILLVRLQILKLEQKILLEKLKIKLEIY